MMFINFFVAFCLRFFLSFIPGLDFDMGTWFSWAERLVDLPWAGFYSKDIWTNYTPGYFYVLYLLRRFELLLKTFFELPTVWREVLFKIPTNLTDILTGILIYKILKRKSPQIAGLAAALYLFNLAIIFNSSVWGQIDSVMTFLMLLALYLLLNKKIIASSFFYGLAFLVKPQSLFLAPLFFLRWVGQKTKKECLKFSSVFLLTVLVLSWPFFPSDPFGGIWKMILQMGKDYPYTTLNAFNSWYLIGNWQSDQALFLAIPKYFWGLGIFLLFETLIILKVFFKKELLKNKAHIFLLASLLMLNFFLFPTRIHERYLFPFFAFFVIAAFSFRSFQLVFIYLFLSLVHFLNLYYVYYSYQENFLKINFLYGLIANLGPLFSLLTVVIFGYLFYGFWQEKTFPSNFFDLLIRRLMNKSSKVNRKRFKIISIQNRWLFLIFLFALVTRFWNLSYPPRFYFDEVYHAFTATEMAKGNVAAWEWWNKPPEGVAYEWTHPPLAKLLMVLGIKFFGQTSFAWRFFGGLLGVGCVLLVYLVGKKLFDQKLAILASFLFAFDGLPLVMSRIGMNDIYFLFFTLLTLWLSLEKKYLFAGLTFGLALSSKWTAVYLLPVLGLWALFNYLKQKKNKGFKWLKRSLIPYTLYLILIPPIVYLLSYFPFFVSGHSFSQWWELQRQMWWYHTHLKATHTYQSSALSWPILVRPVWFFVDYKEELIANIYAMGNPIVWWGGLISLPFVVWQALKKRNWQLGLVIFAYFAFFLPWVFSPRIMFIYHYLPSIPFLCLFLGWTLGQLWQKKEFKLLITSYLLLITITFLFFYPHWTGLHVPRWLDNLYYWFPSWK